MPIRFIGDMLDAVKAKPKRGRPRAAKEGDAARGHSRSADSRDNLVGEFDVLGLPVLIDLSAG